MTIPTFSDFLHREAADDIERATRGEMDYVLRPLNGAYPSVRDLHARGHAVRSAHIPPMRFAVGVQLGCDSRPPIIFETATMRDARNLGRQFLFQLDKVIDDENVDVIWNSFVLQAARMVDVRLKLVCGITPPNSAVVGPKDGDHLHEWHWTGTWTDALPFPIWHMRCACGGWALLANQIDLVSGKWIGFDGAVHDIRGIDGAPAAVVN